MDLYRGNGLMYTIENLEMQKLFQVDRFGNFKITASSLTINQSINGNGTFHVPILLRDLEGNTKRVSVIVQLSNLLKQVKCPQIADSTLCKFSINRTSFDPSKQFKKKE